MKEKQKKRFKKESLLSKINIFSLCVETNASNSTAEQVSAEKTKKKAQISRHKLTPLKHSYTNNVLCYPIRCCAIRSLERRFQEKRQSSVSRGGVVLVLLVFFARIVLF